MEIDEDLKEFLVEGYEHLNQLEGDLVALGTKHLRFRGDQPDLPPSAHN